jgi:glycosyltransferase involved in cell wall biosynthesis
MGAESFEWIGGRVFNGIVTATPKIASRFPRPKTVTIQNFPIHNEWVSLPILPFTEREPHVIYSGNITAARGVREMVTAMELLPKKLKARLKLLGTFVPEALKTEMKGTAGWKQVDFHEWMPRTQLGTFTTRMCAGLVLFHPLRNHVEAQPNKIFEYMSAGIPLIVSNFPLWRELVETHRCGLLVDPKDPEAIAKAITFILENREEAEAMGRRGRTAVEESFNWNVESRNLLGLYERLVQ